MAGRIKFTAQASQPIYSLCVCFDRMLPKIEIGDLLLIHDTGAHGFSMGYNYNGKLKSAELLLKEDGSAELIRRAETPQDYFATFDCFDILKDCQKR